MSHAFGVAETRITCITLLRFGLVSLEHRLGWSDKFDFIGEALYVCEPMDDGRARPTVLLGATGILPVPTSSRNPRPTNTGETPVPPDLTSELAKTRPILRMLLTRREAVDPQRTKTWVTMTFPPLRSHLI